MSVSEQRYQAVLAVISEGETVTDVAARFGGSRQTMHIWLTDIALSRVASALRHTVDQSTIAPDGSSGEWPGTSTTNSPP
jgi:transposase-like protein